ncbi:hypothetical protein [Cellulomonas sp. NPDC089187]|uniref:hypothetical protein n=1 Tax=Cellulomonas sp. NPDC089187 TaxID=3154970 RepID=UPI003421E8DA
MRHQERRGVEFPGQPGDQLDHLGAAGVIQGRGRFIHQQDIGPSDPLPLSPGQVRGLVHYWSSVSRTWESRSTTELHRQGLPDGRRAYPPPQCPRSAGAQSVSAELFSEAEATLPTETPAPVPDEPTPTPSESPAPDPLIYAVAFPGQTIAESRYLVDSFAQTHTLTAQIEGSDATASLAIPEFTQEFFPG